MSDLNTQVKMPPSYRLAAFDCLDSTNSHLRRSLDETPDLEQNLVIWAKEQTQGRGRRERSWVSEPGNLFFSILKRPQRPLNEWANCSFALALGLYEGLAEILKGQAVELSLKWPNDLLIDQKKISGILLESFQIMHPDKAALIIGVGLNIKSFPDPVLYQATCLENYLNEPVQSDYVLEILLHHINLWFCKWEEDGFIALHGDWTKRAKGIGQEITVHLENEKISGQFSGLDLEGALLLETPLGQKKITAGDIFF